RRSRHAPDRRAHARRPGRRAAARARRGPAAVHVRAMTTRARVAGALLAALAAGCSDSRNTPAPPPAPLVGAATPTGLAAGGPGATAPITNALTEARAQLGRRLFFDPRLSRTNDVSCSTCHQQEHAFSDPKAVSTGTNGLQGTRNAPALVNLAWQSTFFWDG